MSQILQQDSQSLLRFERYTYTMMFGHYSCRNWRYWQLNPLRDMLAIYLWGPLALIDNFWIAMLMEAIGIRPQRYCIYFEDSLESYYMLQLVLYALPQERMFLYPASSILGGPFLREPWLSTARAIQSRPSLIEEEYVASFVHFWDTISFEILYILMTHLWDCTFIYLDLSYVYDHCTLIYNWSFVVPESCFLFCCLC